MAYLFQQGLPVCRQRTSTLTKSQVAKRQEKPARSSNCSRVLTLRPTNARGCVTAWQPPEVMKQAESAPAIPRLWARLMPDKSRPPAEA